MADALSTPAPSTPPRKKRRALRILGWTALSVFVLLVVAWFVLTSAPFFRKVVLPRVSDSINADVTVRDASIRPFSSVVLYDLKVHPRGEAPLLSAKQVRLRYSLFAILGGTVLVEEAFLDSPVITLVEDPDGRTNVDPLLQETEEEPAAETPQLDIRRVAISNAVVHYEKRYADSTRDTTAVSNLNVTLTGLKNGDSGRLAIAATVSMNSGWNAAAGSGSAGAAAGTLQASFNGDYTFALSPDLNPISIKGNSQFAVNRAEGTFADLSALGVDLVADVAPGQIIELALRFRQGETQLGALRANGPFSIEKMEGLVNVELTPIDRRVLNLFGAPSGLDFGTTTLTSTNRVQLANAGTEASLAGQFDIARMQVIQGGQSTPTLDLRATYDFRIDLAAGNLMVRAFDLNGTQQGRPFLRGELSEPLVWNWGGSGGEAGVSSLKLSVTNLALADWQALLGEGLSGRAGLQLTVASQQSGRQLNFDLAAWLQDLSVAAGTNRISGIDVQAGLRGTAADRMAFDYRLDVHGTQQRQEALPALSVSGKGNYNFDTTAAEVDVLAQSALPELFSLLAQPEMKAESGALLLNAKITQTGAGQVVLGEASLTNFTGHAAGSAFRHYGLNATFDIQSDAESIRIRDVHGTFSENGRAGGAFQLNGSHRIASSSGQFSVTLSDLNQNALRPFLESLFADKTLVSATLNATASADYDATDKPAIRAEIDLANLVVAGKQEQPPRALEAHLALDTTLQSTAAEIRKFELGLTPTQRAENRLHIAGRLDFSDTNALQGNLKIAADSLDLTSYYELFEPAPGTQPGTQTERPAGAIPEPAAAAQTEPEQEPEPIGIRFRNLVADASISRLYLREIEITNLQTRIHLDGAKFLMDPCRLVLNGAPVSARADVDLSVRGYAYALAFDADAVPFAPLVNTFQPDRKDQLGGTLSAHADIKGIGITGPSLQRSLAGSFDIGTTNLNLAPQNIRSPLLKLIVTVVSMVPDLAGNPQAALGTLAGSLVGSLTQKLTGGSMMEVTNSPIDIVHAEGTIANGRVELKQATVRSTVFQADAMGSVLLAPVLSNSTVNIPISIALTRPLAERINMVPPDTPTNALYVKLPDFFSAEGTLGQPRPRINTAALAVPVLKQFGVEIPGTGGTNTGVGGLLRGILNPQTPPPATDTNQPPATNQNPVGNILNRILGQ